MKMTELGRLTFTLDTLKNLLPDDELQQWHRQNLTSIEEVLRYALPLIQEQRDSQAGLLEQPLYKAN